MFHHKRLEGEWFSLHANDLARLSSELSPATQASS